MEPKTLKLATSPADMLGDVVKEIDEKSGIIVSYPTIEVEDRDGDIVRIGDGKDTGLLLDAFMANPVGLWQHGGDYNRGMTPVYAVKSLTPTTVKRKKAIEAVEQWDNKAPEDPFPRVLFRMHTTTPPMLRARSIRFFPLGEQKERQPSEESGLPFKGYDFIKSELREISAVAIGANPLALTVAVKSEICDVPFLVEHGILKGMADGDRMLGVVGELLADEVQSRVDAGIAAFKADFEKRLKDLEPRPDALAELLRLTLLAEK